MECQAAVRGYGAGGTIGMVQVACRLCGLSDAALRLDLALGVRRRHAPKSCQK